jgi:hypothetical protein
MKKSSQTVNESLNKMKYLMGYDSSMTQIENESIKTLNEQDSNLSDTNSTTEENPNCPNSIPYMEIVKKMKKVAHIVRRMNTAFVRMVGSGKRVQYIYQTMKSLLGKNSYAEDFGECVPAIPAATAYFNGYFSDWFSKGESFEEELSQLIRRRYYRNDPVVQKYLKETLKLLQTQPTKVKSEKISGDTQPEQQPKAPDATTGGYKFVKGTADDPYKYGTLGSGIAQVQQNLGVVQDGKWGPKTDAKMKELAPEYTDGYTNEDILKVIQKIRSTNNPDIKTIKPTTQGEPSIAPPLNRLQLAPMAINNPTKSDAKRQYRLVKKQDKELK